MIRKIEELSMNAIPSLSSTFYNGWVLRYSEGLSKRANSVYPIYKGSQSMEQGIDYCESFYRQKEQRPIFKITEMPEVLKMDGILESKGYEKVAPTNILTLDLEKTNNLHGGIKLTEDYDMKVSEHFEIDWLEGYMVLNDVALSKQHIFKNMLPTSSCDVIALSLYKDDKLIGIGYGAGEENMLGVYGIAIDPEYRGRGLGKALMDALHNESRVRGYTTAYLMVVDDNSVAKSLYKGLGYVHAYKYWYRVSRE